LKNRFIPYKISVYEDIEEFRKQSILFFLLSELKNKLFIEFTEIWYNWTSTKRKEFCIYNKLEGIQLRFIFYI
jgi:hypothetical protein